MGPQKCHIRLTRRIMENKSEMPLKLTDSLSVHVMLDDSPPVC